ncbi:AMP-binding protein [Saccharomonospora sp. NPDC046836]|uniref:AMP-binding protein n=1 Tax=Saccharomonospora sp. NPDC046836 TaxID=3156921 RepID=UPI0033E7F80E
MTAEAGNVADLLATVASDRPEQTALIDTVADTALTWPEIDSAASTQARRLQEAGLRPGDRVALRLPTSIEFAVAFFAVTRAGGIAVPVSPQAPDAELGQVLDDSGARLLLSAGAEELADGVTVLTPVVEVAPAEPLIASGGGEDIAALMYTSGTTGGPRGVMLSHRALLTNVAQLHSLPTRLAEPGDRVLIAIPLHHIYGLGPGLLSAVATGATAVLAPRFDVHKALAACAAHRVSVIVGVPAMYTEFARLPADEVKQALATARLLVSGAAPLRPDVLAAIRAATGLAVYEGYGLTEAAPVVTSTLVTGNAKPGSVGHPLPGVEVRLVDSDGTPGPVALDPEDPADAFPDDTGGTGLVAIHGDNLLTGYWPDGAHGPDADGWFRTGDVGYLDTDGDLHLVDRANDLIIVNGFNVYPREVEDVIAALPEVAEVAVVGLLDERTGEAVKAVVVPAAGVALSEQQVMQACETTLARYKVPSTVEFAHELPRSPTGKLRRFHVRG